MRNAQRRGREIDFARDEHGQNPDGGRRGATRVGLDRLHRLGQESVGLFPVGSRGRSTSGKKQSTTGEKWNMKFPLFGFQENFNRNSSKASMEASATEQQQQQQQQVQEVLKKPSFKKSTLELTELAHAITAQVWKKVTVPSNMNPSLKGPAWTV